MTNTTDNSKFCMKLIMVESDESELKSMPSKLVNDWNCNVITDFLRVRVVGFHEVYFRLGLGNTT